MQVLRASPSLLLPTSKCSTTKLACLLEALDRYRTDVLFDMWDRQLMQHHPSFRFAEQWIWGAGANKSDLTPSFAPISKGLYNP